MLETVELFIIRRIRRIRLHQTQNSNHHVDLRGTFDLQTLQELQTELQGAVRV